MRPIRQTSSSRVLRDQASGLNKLRALIRGRLLPKGYTFAEDDSGDLIILKGDQIVAQLTGAEHGQE